MQTPTPTTTTTPQIVSEVYKGQNSCQGIREREGVGVGRNSSDILRSWGAALLSTPEFFLA